MTAFEPVTLVHVRDSTREPSCLPCRISHRHSTHLPSSAPNTAQQEVVGQVTPSKEAWISAPGFCELSKLLTAPKKLGSTSSCVTVHNHLIVWPAGAPASHEALHRLLFLGRGRLLDDSIAGIRPQRVLRKVPERVCRKAITWAKVLSLYSDSIAIKNTSYTPNVTEATRSMFRVLRRVPIRGTNEQTATRWFGCDSAIWGPILLTN